MSHQANAVGAAASSSNTQPLASLADHPATEAFAQELRSRGYTDAAIANVSYARRDRFHREFGPRMTSAFPESAPASTRKVVEIGCGAGSVTHAFTEIFKNVDAFEIDLQMFELCLERKKAYGLDNLELHHLPPADVVAAAVSAAEPGSVFMLFAVLEHMIEDERLATLSGLWKAMDPQTGIPDAHIYVGNTPNRLSWQDLHTHEIPFLVGLPDKTAHRYLGLHPDLKLASHLLQSHVQGGEEGFALTRARRGLGVSFHDFEIAFEGVDLDTCVILPDIVKPWQSHDALLMSFLLSENIKVPVCFGVRDMNFMLKRPRNKAEADAIRAHNVSIRKTYATMAAKQLDKISKDLLALD